MNASIIRNSPHSEPKSALAGALAVFVHLFFVALLVFGLNWKDHPPEGMIVDIWTELPKPIQEPVKSQPQPKQSVPVQEPVKPKIEPQPPKPEPPKPVPQKAIAEPPVKKPDIAVKQKPEPVKEPPPDLQEQKKKEQEKVKEQERLKELEKQKELEKKKE